MSVCLLGAPATTKCVDWCKYTPGSVREGMLVLVRVSVHKTEHCIIKARKRVWLKTHAVARYVAEEVVGFDDISP